MGSNTFSTFNPNSGDLLKTYKYLNDEEARQELLAAQKDFEVWRKSSFSERWETALALAEVLRRYKNELVEQMTLEMGKLPAEGKLEVDKCIATCEYYAKEGEKLLSPRKVDSGYQKSWVSFQPQGVILSIMPWNFPLWQVMRFAVPAIMAGNVILLKHADITSGTAEVIGRMFKDLRKDLTLLRQLFVDHETVATLIASPHVHGVTFTGSSRGGKEVAVTAARNLKKTVLELGGSDAYIILEDADIEWAAKSCAKARLVNAGQSCVAGKRFIVHEQIAKKFTDAFVKAMKESTIAPLASKRFQKQIIEQVEVLKSLGGEVLLGGTAPEGGGAYYPPTVILFKKDHHKIHEEEVFGPVASVLIAKDAADALRIANSGPYGLGGGLFTGDPERGKTLVENEMQAGFVVVNDYVKSDPRLPFGGVKDSGYGRELGEFGIMEFVNVKTVAVGQVV
jgi:succinate-semialdehyde dehydrogenase/glutarate-semialdehyde dehydrogenase